MKKITSILVALMACAALAENSVQIHTVEDQAVCGNLTAYEMQKHRTVERWWKPRQGYMHVHVEIEIGNADAEREYSGFKFKLIDKVNRQWKSWYGAQGLKQPNISVVTLAPGETIRGWVSFELPKNTILNGFKIRYDDGTARSGDAEIPKYK